MKLYEEFKLYETMWDQLEEESSKALLEGPFDFLKKTKKLTQDQKDFVQSIETNMSKFVKSNLNTEEVKALFNSVGAESANKFWNKCQIILCPMLEKDAETLGKSESMEAKSLHSAVKMSKELAKGFKDEISTHKKLFGSLPMPVLFCVRDDFVISPEFQRAFAKKLPLNDLALFNFTRGYRPLILGVYDLAANPEDAFLIPTYIKDIFSGDITDLIKISKSSEAQAETQQTNDAEDNPKTTESPRQVSNDTAEVTDTTNADNESDVTSEPKNVKLNRARQNNNKIVKAFKEVGLPTDDLVAIAKNKNGRDYKKASDKLNKLRKTLFGEAFEEELDSPFDQEF